MSGPSTDKGTGGRTGKEKGLDISKEGDGKCGYKNNMT